MRLDPELAGGALMDVGCYCVSVSRLLAGEPESVSGAAGARTERRRPAARGHARLPRRRARSARLRVRPAVSGSARGDRLEGALRVVVAVERRVPGIEVVQRGDDVEQIPVRCGVDPYRLQCDNFSRAVRGLEQPFLGRADAIGQARAIDSLYRSAEAGGASMQL